MKGWGLTHPQYKPVLRIILKRWRKPSIVGSPNGAAAKVFLTLGRCFFSQWSMQALRNRTFKTSKWLSHNQPQTSLQVCHYVVWCDREFYWWPNTQCLCVFAHQKELTISSTHCELQPHHVVHMLMCASLSVACVKVQIVCACSTLLSSDLQHMISI